jgi:hypothetical protein
VFCSRVNRHAHRAACGAIGGSTRTAATMWPALHRRRHRRAGRRSARSPPPVPVTVTGSRPRPARRWCVRGEQVPRCRRRTCQSDHSARPMVIALCRGSCRSGTS